MPDKPLLTGRKSYKQGYFKPKYPSKYCGNPCKIVFRSGWERMFMIWCDITRQVVKWGSEELVIPYQSPVDGQTHRYFVDFVVYIQTPDGVQKYCVEIKPFAQTQPPKMPRKKSLIESYQKSVETFAVNQAKWKYAEDFCNKHGMKFIVLTERELMKK